MPVKDPKEVFLSTSQQRSAGCGARDKNLSRDQSTRSGPGYKRSAGCQGLSSPSKPSTKLDRCFELLGEKPVKSAGRLQETFIEDFRRELAEIQSPVAKHLFILAKANHLTHLRIGEYVTLTAAADLTGHHAVGVLLESCLADRLASWKETGG